MTETKELGMSTFNHVSKHGNLKAEEQDDGEEGGECEHDAASVSSSLSVCGGSSRRSFTSTSDSSQLSWGGGAEPSGTTEDTDIDSSSWSSDEDTESGTGTSESASNESQEGSKGGAPVDGVDLDQGKRRKRRKERSMRIRALVAKIETSIRADPDGFSLGALERGLPVSVVKDGKLGKKLMQRLRAILHDARTSPRGGTTSSPSTGLPLKAAGAEPATPSTSGSTSPRPPTKMSL